MANLINAREMILEWQVLGSPARLELASWKY